MSDFPSILRILTAALILASAAAATEPSSADKPAPAGSGSSSTATPEQAEFFEKKIRPVLAAHCYECHSAVGKKQKGGLLLDSRAAMLTGGDTGPAIVPGKPTESLLISAVGYANTDLQMPPTGRIPAAAIADLTEWVRQGAPWPGGDASSSTSKPTGSGFDLAARRAAHWCWQPIRLVDPPSVGEPTLSPVDRFLLARLAEKGLQPAAEADRATLIRRLSFDLRGLPPSPEEVRDFLADARPDAWERLVDRLLADPAFGEHWARHWLDLVRYAESRGHEFDYAIPNAWQYRDYVIRALNADVPYDRLLTEHLTGDLLAEPRRHPTAGFNESILGTGFFFLGEEVHSPVDVRGDEAERFDNRIDVLSKTFLGLTISCARCHDHKFDAISTRDYYALYGVLESTAYRQVRFDSRDAHARIAGELDRLRTTARPTVNAAAAEALRPMLKTLAADLLAARAVLAAGRADPDPRIAAWAAHLRRAASDPADPFHAWAKLAVSIPDKPDKTGKPATEPTPRETLTKLLAKSAESPLPTEASVVLNFAESGPADWRPDDASFGTGPIRPGELRLDGGRPRLADGPAAAELRPLLSQGLKFAPGSEQESGALGFVRAGRTLRTPSFEIRSGQSLYALVRGACRSYVAVGHHVLIHGPLHGSLVRQHKPKGLGDAESWRWIRHDVGGYVGQRAHVELTADTGPDGDRFAVAMVVQSPTPPTAVSPGGLHPELAERLAGPAGESAEALATGYAEWLSGVLDRLAADRVVGSPTAAADAAVVNALLTRLPPGAVADKLAETLAGIGLRADEVVAELPRESRLAPAIWDGSGVEPRVFIRGSHKSLGDAVTRRLPEALVGDRPLADPASRVGSGRLELARQLCDPTVAPLVPRVAVNRIWHHVFGRGLVASTDNFGVLGELPTHPELLDYLADRLVRDGWSIKRMVRRLVTTRAYRMSSVPNSATASLLATADPANLLLHRARVRRLSGEAIRDAMLAISGRLDRRQFGPPVATHLTDFQQGRGRPGASGPLDGDGRRSVYLAVRRNFLSPMMLAYDTPIPFSTVGRRTVSNVPAQALILMNDPFVHQQAKLWGQRMHALGGGVDSRVTLMYDAAFARPPSTPELRACRAFVIGSPESPKPESAAAWADLAHALFNVKEFVFVP